MLCGVLKGRALGVGKSREVSSRPDRCLAAGGGTAFQGIAHVAKERLRFVGTTIAKSTTDGRGDRMTALRSKEQPAVVADRESVRERVGRCEGLEDNHRR